MMTSKKQRWAESILLNDEYSTDRELLEHFMKEGKMSYDDANFYVNQRNKALLNPLNYRVIHPKFPKTVRVRGYSRK